MALAGAPARAPHRALLVGSNPAITRVLRTFLQREGIHCREATPESVLRAATRLRLSGEVDGPYVDPAAVALIVVSVGINVAGIREALASLPATAGAPVLTVDSLAGDGARVGSGTPNLPTLAWPFRLRDVMDAITTAVAVRGFASEGDRSPAPTGPVQVTSAHAEGVSAGAARP